MKIVIIEDEPLTARDLAACIVAAEPSAEIVASLASVGEATAWFARHEAPDLIFSDIQLGDGKSFVVFERLMQLVPVIFCTAYDAYALEAFRAAGIDYILKPFDEKSVGSALEKFRALRGAPAVSRGTGAILVFYKEKILPVKVGDIALFYLQNELVRLVTFEKKEYIVNKPLEELEGLAGGAFYRVNRQFLVNRQAIKDVSQYFGRKLLVNLCFLWEEKITVGRLKVNDFLGWLSGS
ncbi:LytR/AlgR family response regulator transcription factor [Puia dinghuensis]|uniref:DNA-binding response regulator n=1 Tax=Puia dinghuensis TaxID=1792502 RepID=A0A8J2UCG3_9BACT|nr:LytTR family DNA-binding domain-containing protein [Puia dinghuensis]GGA95564.1 DNA-binding response regulator [Puia dinghuensis]